MHGWLPGLNVGKEWNRTQKDISESDIVLVIEPNSPRGYRQLGRVLEIQAKMDMCRCQSKSRTEINEPPNNLAVSIGVQ